MAGTGRSDWSDPGNAAAYRQFTRSFPLYRDTSRDLVARAGIETARTVVDLCSGTGATSEVILEHLPEPGRLLAADGSAAMLAEARAATEDARVRYVVCRAEEFDRHVEGRVDAVICNSAIWQTDMPEVFAAVRRVLAPGGRLVFNVGGAFVGLQPTHDPRPRKPGIYDLMLAYAILDHDFVPTGGRRSVPGLTPETIEQMLRDAGLAPTAREIIDYPGSVEQTRAWLSIPVFSFPFTSMSYDQRMDILAKAYQRIDDKAATSHAPWLVVTATLP